MLLCIAKSVFGNYLFTYPAILDPLKLDFVEIKGTGFKPQKLKHENSILTILNGAIYHTIP